MKVCIAEKPSVAREIAAILGAREKHDGYLEGNGYRVTWTFGHLCTLKEPQDYRPDWRVWAVRNLPMIPPRFGIKPIDITSYRKQLDIIARIVAEAEEVINCGDAGQEGELIQRWVLQQVGCNCPVKRLWISSLTKEAISEGFASLKPAESYQALYEAGLARAIGDWLLGLNATRLYTLLYGSRGQTLSVGRVQTPTLALLVSRRKEIESFIPEPYWELKTTYRSVLFHAAKGRYTDREEALAAIEQIREGLFEITSIEGKKGKDLPPYLFDLTGLQVECNKKFGLSAEETLHTVQTLYERKLTTYPRVDTVCLPEDIYPKAPDILKGLKGYEPYVQTLLQSKLRKSKKVFDNSKITDHHAIIPTGQPATTLSASEEKVYDLIVRRFLAAFYPDCLFNTTTVLGQVEQIPFKATGKVITQEGWRILFAKPSAEEKEEEESATEEEERSLPLFEVGEQGEHLPDLQEKQTLPPKQYTEATLLRTMETAGKLTEDESLRSALKENGIGRPSTRASIIETLLKRGYVEKKRKALIATDLGVRLIDLVKSDLLKSVELTGLWERKLRQIEKLQLPAASFIDELKSMVHQVVTDAFATPAPASSPASDTELFSIHCPLCQEGHLLRGRTAYGCSAWQKGCSWRMSFEQCPKEASADQIRSALQSSQD